MAVSDEAKKGVSFVVALLDGDTLSSPISLLKLVDKPTRTPKRRSLMDNFSHEYIDLAKDLEAISSKHSVKTDTYRTAFGKLTEEMAATKLRELAKQLEIIQHDIRQCVDVLTEGER